MAFKMLRNIAGYDISAKAFKVGASTTITKGNAVVLSSGLVVEASDSSTAILGIAAQSITTVSGETDKTIDVYVDPNIIWRVPYYTGGSKTDMAQSDVGAAGFGLKTAGTINPDDTTGPVVKVVDFDATANTADVIITSRTFV